MWGTVLSRLQSACKAMTLARSVESVIPLRPAIGASSQFHSLSHPIKPSPLTNQCSRQAVGSPSPLLSAPPVPFLNFVCGFKVKGRLKRRCKDCYFVMRQERLYVICKTHPRHKQMSMKKHDHNTWILTDATQGKVRAW
uniref:Ribosomal protein n=1 Tax=Anopheles epiroticus TaxID=199890 RepID=A0A182P6C0_9DIPT